MKKFAKFCIVGACNTAITFLTYYFLYKIIGVGYMISSLIGYVAGVMNSFTMNRRWTFNDRNGKIFSQFTRFILINTISLGVNLAILYACVEWLNLGKLLSQLVAIGFSTIINFTGSRIVVFQKKQDDTDSEEILSYIK